MKFACLLSVISLGIIPFISAVDFDKEIKPVLKNRCGKCHMDGESKGKVALDPNLIAKEIGPDGTIVPGDVKKSDLHWTMTLDASEDLAMPPKGKRVPQAEIDLIAKWIEEGAKLGAPGGGMADTGGSMGDDSMSGDSMGMGGGMAEAPSAPAQKPYKGTFKNKKGMQVPATLVRVEGDRAILVLPDKKEYRYPISMFAPETQKIVKKFQDGTLEPSM